MQKKRYWKWVCEFCFKRSNHNILPNGWELVWQSAVCPDCQKHVANDGGYFVVKGGAYAGTRRDPRIITKTMSKPSLPAGKLILILCEIEWCKAHRGESQKGDVWEDGFVAGLEQALRIMKRRGTKSVLRRAAKGMHLLHTHRQGSEVVKE